MKTIRLLHISDWHGNLPDFFYEIKDLNFDLLISTGDMLANEFPKSKGYEKIKAAEAKFQKKHIKETYSEFCKWLKEKKTPVLCVDGNHDFISFSEYLLEEGINSQELKPEKSIEIQSFKFSGHPFIPFCGKIWNHEKKEAEIANIMKSFPEAAEILVTHAPPYEILDDSRKYGPLGSKSMLTFLIENKTIKLNLYGHSHDTFGFLKKDGKYFSNAATGARLLEIRKNTDGKIKDVTSRFEKRKEL